MKPCGSPSKDSEDKTERIDDGRDDTTVWAATACIANGTALGAGNGGIGGAGTMGTGIAGGTETARAEKERDLAR